MLNTNKKIQYGCIVGVFLALWMGLASTAQAYIQSDRIEAAAYDGSNKAREHTANSTTGSTADYAFRLHDLSRKQALQAIAEKADLTLAYCSDLFKTGSTVSVSGSKMNYKSAIKKVLRGSGLGYKVTGSRHLVVYKKKKANVAGTVIDKTTAMPLQGARVMLIDEKRRTAADPTIKRATFVDSEGQYRIDDVDPGTYKLVITYFGYNKAFEHVRVKKGTTVGNFQIQEKE